MKVLCCGSRNWHNIEKVVNAFSELLKEGPIERILQGGAVGADHWCALEATRRGIRVFEYPAEWDKYGRSAGYIRNKEMIDENPDVVLAFQRDKSKGTQHTIDLAQKKGIRVIIYKEGR
jgi:hypothetical protein